MTGSFRFAQVASLILLGTALLSFANAPIGIWPLAWIGLAPWLIAVGDAPTMRSALARGWLTGCIYFAANLWWLWTASIPGAIVLIIYFALYWALAAGLVHAFRLVNHSNAADPPHTAITSVSFWSSADMTVATT